MSNKGYVRLCEVGIEAQRAINEFISTDFGELSAEQKLLMEETLLEATVASLFASSQFVTDFKWMVETWRIAPVDVLQTLIDLTRELAQKPD